MIAVLLTSVMLFACAVGLSGCRIFETKADKYTVEEHLERIAKKVDKRYMSGDYDFTSYELYPLYNENEKMDFVLVEFEPQGFILVQLQRGTFGQIKYRRDDKYLEIGWSRLRYEIIEEGQKASDFEDDVWKLIPEAQHIKMALLREYDENGEVIVYYVSPYKLAGVLDQRLYCVAGQFVAIKTENGYLNLMSMKEFVYCDGMGADDEPQFGGGVLPYDTYNL